MKVKNIELLPILAIITNLLTGCTSISSLTGDKLIKNENNTLIVQSNVDMTDTNINSLLPGKIKEIKVKEGDSVEKGQVLMIMDSDSLAAQQSQIQAQIEAVTAQVETVTAQIKSAESARDAAKAKLEATQNGARPEEIDQAKAASDLAKVTHDRLQVLYEEGSIPKSDLDNAETQMQVAKDKYDIAKQGSRPEEIKAAQAQVDQANASVEATQGQFKAAQGQLKAAQAQLQGIDVNLNYATITAPTDGIVTQINVELGELVSTGMPLTVITDSNTPSILCNVKETDLSKVELNQEVSVKIPACGEQSYKGKVVKINKDADFAVKRATNDNGDFDVLSYGVKVELTDMDKPLRAGMTAFVDFGK